MTEDRFAGNSPICGTLLNNTAGPGLQVSAIYSRL